MESGFLLIDKQQDWTSHDVVGYLRSVTGIRKIGHAGTLDPFATGLLIVGVGRAATKRLDEFKGMEKVYTAIIKLGGTSDTQDRTGTITPTEKQEDTPVITKEKIIKTLETFVGTQKQTPPMYSAKKVKGKKLYELARQGKVIEREPNDITIYAIDFINWDEEKQLLEITCRVSTGTYIRTLSHDIGQVLGVGGYCEELRRTSIGEYSVEDALDPKMLEKETWNDRLISC
jgi:tRNA pseudouridine55 synthase